MQHHIADGAPNASVSRRVFIAGMSAACVPAPAAAIEYEPDELDQLIFRAKALKLQFQDVERQVSALLDRPDRPPFPMLRAVEIDRAAYVTWHNAEFRNDQQIREFFDRLRKCIFGSRSSKERHDRNERLAIDELQMRIDRYSHWETATGLKDLAQEETELCTAWLAAERHALVYPCRDFSMVERKVAFMREILDGEDFGSEFAISILMTMDGRGA